MPWAFKEPPTIILTGALSGSTTAFASEPRLRASGLFEVIEPSVWVAFADQLSFNDVLDVGTAVEPDAQRLWKVRPEFVFSPDAPAVLLFACRVWLTERL
jgi:hypothetical protein